MRINWDCSPAPNRRYRHWRAQISANYRAAVTEDIQAGTFEATGVNGGACKATEDFNSAERKAMMAVRRQALDNIREAERVLAFLDALARESRERRGRGVSALNITEYVYDPAGAGMSYGYYRCHGCGNTFFGGGPPLHVAGCGFKVMGEKATYAYHFGDKEVAIVKQRFGKTVSENPNGRLRMAVLTKQFPELLT